VSVVASLLYSLRFLVRSRTVLYLEIVALRHHLVVATSFPSSRLRFATVDRVRWAWLSRRGAAGARHSVLCSSRRGCLSSIVAAVACSGRGRADIAPAVDLTSGGLVKCLREAALERR